MEQQPNISVRILLPFCIGIWVLHGIHFTKLNLLLQLSILLLFILLFIFNCLYTSLKVYHHKILIGYLFHLFFFSLGGLIDLNHNDLENSDHFSHSSAEYLKICVADEPQQKGNVVRFSVKVIAAYNGKKKQPVTGSLLVILYSKTAGFSPLRYGETYLIPARYTTVDPPFNPAEFDFTSWLANQNIHHQIFLSPTELTSTGEHGGSALVKLALSLRKRQVETYRKLIRNDQAFAVASTLILGYRSDLDAATLAAYSRTGTIHALSVSGMHVGIVYLVLDWTLRWMNRKIILKWIKVFCILILIWFYTILTGYSASVLRSAIMLTFFILAKSVNKQAGSYHVLACSAFCLLVYDPFLLWDTGFQLSYMAVLGLVYLQPKIYQLFSFKWVVLQKLWNMVSLSLAAQVMTFPFSIYYFHQFPVYFLLSNLFITLPVTLLMYAGLLLLLFKLYWLAPFFEWMITFMNRGLEYIACLPYSTISSIWLTKTELILLCLAMCFLFAVISTQKKGFIFAALCTLISLQGLMIKDKITALKQKRVILFSLQKNYAVAFIHATRAVLITDLIPADKDFKFHIQPALDQQKISTLVCIPLGKYHQNHGLIVKDHQELKIKDHQLRFRNFSVLLVDTCFNRKTILENHHFDAIWIHGSPKIKISKLREHINFRKIWIDASNKRYAIQNFEEEIPDFKHSAIVMKKNKAFLYQLK